MPGFFDTLYTRLFGRKKPIVPVLFRVRGLDGRPVASVEVEARFSPGNERVKGRRHVDASGTCLLHWPREAESVHVRISDGFASAELDVETQRAETHRVVEVRLSEPP